MELFHIEQYNSFLFRLDYISSQCWSLGTFSCIFYHLYCLLQNFHFLSNESQASTISAWKTNSWWLSDIVLLLLNWKLSLINAPCPFINSSLLLCEAVLLCCLTSDTPLLRMDNFLLQILQFAGYSSPLTGLIQLKRSFKELLNRFPFTHYYLSKIY